MPDERIDREKSFHDRRFGGDTDPRGATGKYYSIMQQPRMLYRNLASANCVGGKLLEFGCATGDQSQWWMDAGAQVTGIDISSVAIDRANQRWVGTRYEDKSQYFEMDAEALSFEAESFDVVVGNGIIHHLDLDECFSEIARVLKHDGLAVFMEPMGHNPFINLYRHFTPDMRTEDEHPLKVQDIKLASKYFRSVTSTPFHLFTILAVPFRNTSIFSPLLKILYAVDRSIFKIPILRRQAWFTVLELKGPVRENSH